MDTSVIAAITGILQVAGTIVVVKIQRNQIAGLRDNINDQKSSIEALKIQAEGQVSLTGQQQALTNQMRQFMTSVLADADRRLAIVKETAVLETNNIQKKLEDAQTKIEEQKTTQLQEVGKINEQPVVTKLLQNLIEDNANAKAQLASLNSQISNFFSRSDILFDNLVKTNQAAFEQRLTQSKLPIWGAPYIQTAVDNLRGLKASVDSINSFILLKNILPRTNPPLPPTLINSNSQEFKMLESAQMTMADIIDGYVPVESLPTDDKFPNIATRLMFGYGTLSEGKLILGLQIGSEKFYNYCFNKIPLIQMDRIEDDKQYVDYVRYKMGK